MILTLLFDPTHPWTSALFDYHDLRSWYDASCSWSGTNIFWLGLLGSQWQKWTRWTKSGSHRSLVSGRMWKSRCLRCSCWWRRRRGRWWGTLWRGRWRPAGICSVGCGIGDFFRIQRMIHQPLACSGSFGRCVALDWWHVGVQSLDLLAGWTSIGNRGNLRQLFELLSYCACTARQTGTSAAMVRLKLQNYSPHWVLQRIFLHQSWGLRVYSATAASAILDRVLLVVFQLATSYVFRLRCSSFGSPFGRDSANQRGLLHSFLSFSLWVDWVSCSWCFGSGDFDIHLLFLPRRGPMHALRIVPSSGLLSH